MATRRAFTKKITESDAFLDMPLSTQCLYFHLNMNGDDDGFINNPKMIMRLIGASEDDLKLLIAKSFVLAFDSGVIVIKHWRMHNTLQNDRYHPTDYTEEYAQLGLKDNRAYTWKQNGNILETELNLTKHNITKHYEEDIDNIAVSELVSLYREAGIPDNAIRNALDMFKITDTPITADLFSKVIDVYQNGDIFNKVGYAYELLKNEREKL